MRCVVALCFALLALFAPTAHAEAQVLSVETYIEEWDPAQQRWVRVEDGAQRFAPQIAQPVRKAQTPAAPSSIANYGPFRVVDQNRAEMVGVTGRASPAQFAAMLRDYPQISTLVMREAPGTDDDRANMKVGRMIRNAGISTHVPYGGSVRSGAVELFLAGKERRIDDGAEFAVHSWMDEYGRQPQDFAPDSRENRMYLEYYREMGMSAEQAAAFYDMTNSVSYSDAKWLTAQDMRGWLGQAANDNAAADTIAKPAPKITAAPQIAYLDLDALLP